MRLSSGRGISNRTTQKNMEKEFEEISIRKEDASALSYFVYANTEEKEFHSVIVYLHGLASDLSWFLIPENLPEKTAILYLRRQPKASTNNFMEWYDNYQYCLEHFKQTHASRYYHLVANCFGSGLAFIWVTKNPESFTTLTISNPPIAQQKNWPLSERLELFLNVLRSRENFRRIYLYPADYARVPCVMKRIERASDTTFYFTDQFYLQALKQGNWLKQNFITLPIPTHMVLSSEDRIVDVSNPNKSYWGRVKPERITTFHSDHYIELLPQKTDFWKRVFAFQQEYEPDYQENLNIKTVLVTGATGFVGSHIVRQLIAEKYNVVAFIRNKEKAIKLFPEIIDQIEIKQGDATDINSIEAACQNVDAMIHTAAYVTDWGKPEDFRKINVGGTKNLLMISHFKGVKQFIYISSLGVFGDRDQDNINEDSQQIVFR